MRKGENYNRPSPGSRIKVEPIKSRRDIKAIKDNLRNKPLDLALFTLGINTNLRASDLLQIKVKDVKGIKPGDNIELKEKKTSKIRRITLNSACVEVIKNLLKLRQYEEGDYLFRGRGKVLTVPSVHLKVKRWCQEIHLKGNFGSHSLRKTWGYHQHHTFKQPLPLLMECFNHSSQKQTLDYLCIQAEEIRSVYMNEL